MKLTLAQAATRWGWSRTRMYRIAVIEKQIPCVQIGRSWFFDDEELDAWWRRQSQAHVAPAETSDTPGTERSKADERAALGLPERHLFVS